MTETSNRRLVIHRSKIYEVVMPYSHNLELRGEDGSVIRVAYGDPELERAPSAEDVTALRAPKKRKR